jgi:iron(III) transport system substrate-binding protein
MSRISRRSFVWGLPAVAVLSGTRFAHAAAPADYKAIDIAAAKAEGKVVVYASLDGQTLDSVIAGFKAKYGIPVEYFRGSSNDVVAKVFAEAQAGRVQVDVIDTSDVAAIMLMKEKGLLRPFGSESAATISKSLRDADGAWTSCRLTQACLQYNTKELGAKPPQHWSDLTDKAFMSRLTYFSSSNGDGAPRLYTLAEAFGWDLLKKLAANKPLRVASPQLAVQLLESGERSVAFCVNDNIAWRSRQQGKPTTFIYPTEGTPTEPGAMAISMASQRPNAAALFHEYAMGKDGQSVLAGNGKYSPRTDVAPPEGDPPLASVKWLELDYKQYGKKRTEALEKLTEILGGEWGI